MSLISGLPPSAFNSLSAPHLNASEADDKTRSARSDPTPDSPASTKERQPVTASNPTQDNANAANPNVPVGPTRPSNDSGEGARVSLNADPESVFLSKISEEDAAPVKNENQDYRAAKAAEAAYAQQAAIDKLATGASSAVSGVIAALTAPPPQPIGEEGTSLADMGETAAADAEDPLAA